MLDTNSFRRGCSHVGRRMDILIEFVSFTLKSLLSLLLRRNDAVGDDVVDGTDIEYNQSSPFLVINLPSIGSTSCGDCCLLLTLTPSFRRARRVSSSSAD